MNESLLTELHGMLLGNEKDDCAGVDEVGAERMRACLEWFGVVGGERGWKRSIPYSMYSVPHLAAQTTVVDRESLPEHLQGAVLKFEGDTTTEATEEGNVVEVPVSILFPPEPSEGVSGASGMGSDSSLARRPLVGNLSGGLSEFTRGRVGVSRPFRPGGLTSPDTHDDNAYMAEEVDRLLQLHLHRNKANQPTPDSQDPQQSPQPITHLPHRTPHDNKAAKQPLYDRLDNLETTTQHSPLSTASLITAPPGASFKVGLAHHHLQNKSHHHSLPTHKTQQIAQPTQAAHNLHQHDHSLQPELRANIDTSSHLLQWDQAAFDKVDSLFGDESDSHSDSSYSDTTAQTTHSNATDHSPSTKQPPPDHITTQHSNSSPHNESSMQQHQIHDNHDDHDDVDLLLEQLTLSTNTQPTPLLPPKANLPTHLLPTANIQTDNAKNKTNKPRTKHTNANKNKVHDISSQNTLTATTAASSSWAVTTYLDTSQFYTTLVPNPAMTFPFELDEFQKQAVARMERSECIFVAAHTSAGKTVCAEYAVALCERHCTRAVYTSPIKALSNQKYRDFKTKFESVGLITGDLQVNANATCLIMTTEILRSMLYRGADLVRDIEWVIFDEVHYINDTERGVVWEEVIIMLPDYVNLIFLSATTPNTIEFSDWIGRTKRKPVHVIRTNHRPVPLSHHLYAGHKMHKILEGKSAFLTRGYKEAAQALMPASAQKEASSTGAGSKSSKGGVPVGGSNKQQAPKKPSPAPYKHSTGSKQAAWQQQGNKQDWSSLVKFLEREDYMPTVIFSFSKKKCEEIANFLKAVNLNTGAESSAVKLFTDQTVKRLSPSDANLPQVTGTCEMVARGIGVHHGGLLPILKEMVEILFSRNLIKVLFATETFAMGVNMPARAVVFNSIRKHDGTQFRVLQPGEYIQMSGRAGRRGLDKVGTVIICCFGDSPPPQLILKNMLTGLSTKLQSQFRLTYNMILNLLRVEDMSVEDMIKRSFSEFATQRALTTNNYPRLLYRGAKALAKLDAQFEREAEVRFGAEDVEEYFDTCTELLSLNAQIHAFILDSAGGSGGGALVPGRVVFVTAGRKRGYVRAPAIVLRAPTSSLAKTSTVAPVADSSAPTAKGFTPAVCLVLLPENVEASKNEAGSVEAGHLNYVGSTHGRRYAIHEISLNEILFVTSLKQNVDSKVLYKEAAGSSVSGLTSASRTLLSAKDPFFGMKPSGSKRVVDNNPFAGMMSRGKKGGTEGTAMDSRGKSTDSSQYQRSIDEIMNALIDAEGKETSHGTEVLDLRTCTHGVQKGEDAIPFRTECDKMEALLWQVRCFKCHTHPLLTRYYSSVERKETLRARVKRLQHVLSNESLQLFPDFLQRKRLLRTLGYVDENDTVCVKGRVACEVNTCESLIVTEMVFEGILNDLEPAEIVAALSALLFQERRDDEGIDSELPERLVSCCESMKRVAWNLGQLQKEHGLMIDPMEYCKETLKFGLVHVVYEWALGVPFSSICELTVVQEGSIVRCVTRLDELCREVRNCARVVGNPTLYRKLEAASVAIKRDIVFASSLYVS